MRSLRSRIIFINVIAITVAILVATIISAFSIANLGHSSSEQSLRLLCETGKSNLNYYFRSVEQSVKTVSSLIDADLDAIPEASLVADFHEHMEQADTIFREAAVNTNGVLTYYYRIDPAIDQVTGEKGFWYTNLDGKGFVSHPVTDISDEKNKCVWFYTPKETGKPVWLPPYVTDGLNNVYVVSYNVPVYRNNSFVGVVGIEIAYGTLGTQIKDITLLKSGFAFIVDANDGTIIYHPTIDVFKNPEVKSTTPPEFTEQMKKGEHHISYTFRGVEKHCYWLPLSNGMNVVVAVPLAEINAVWISVIIQIVAAAAVIMAAFVAISILLARRFTRPLKALTAAAEEINSGNYDVKLDYKGNDEIGTLTMTVNRLISNLGDYINDLNNLAHTDALTSVSNKNAFDARAKQIQERIEAGEEGLAFAIAILDCDNLKDINDEFGHDKGDIYLRNSCYLMSRVFHGSVVYRIGGDEFVIILEGEEYENREALKRTFIERSDEMCSFAKEPWEKIRVSVGVAAYDPQIDSSVADVLRHADLLMYQNKRKRKKKKA